MALVVGMTTLVVVAFAVPLAVLIRHNVYQDAIRELEKEANDIALYLNSEPNKTQLTAYLDGVQGAASVRPLHRPPIGTAPPGGFGESPEPPENGREPTGERDGEDHSGPPPTHTMAYPGGELAVLQVPPSGRWSSSVVSVYRSDASLHSGETAWWLLLGGVSLGLLLVGIVAAELLTRRLVRPLVRTAETAHRIRAGDVTARAPTEGPREIADVGVALNRLGQRIDELIADERETVADLSHRLRTPLTALRLDAEALADPADAERVGGHVGELERLLTAVIRAARRPEREGRLPSCDATAVVGDRVAFWSALTEDQERSSTVQLPGAPLVVRAAAEDLAAAVDALLENVVAHTPEGTAFAVRLAAVDGGARLEVSDGGPGLPSDAPERGRSDRGSSGLGLDIARRCAEASGGSMTLGASPSGGALVTLELHAP
ncbi:MAG TPA: HAMP domain-containing sensor histidine kinase [Jatrophihabitans sp.]|jgi:signal transduction histidine kinase|nr:HAMP domain-containing sensor histidine kinase [Jatrophihabitans sp.]